MAEFAVIGAGLSGMILASLLKQAGHHCAVFEKSDRPGGRLSTEMFPDWQVDLGTQYFTVRSPLFADEVARWQQEGWVTPWDVQPWRATREELSQEDKNQEDIVASPDDQLRYIGQPTMFAMIEGLSKDLDLYTQTRIDRLEKIENRWRLWDEQGEHYGNFDAVLLTAPMAQSLALMPEDSKLGPQLRTAQMTPTWAYALSFEQPTDIKADALFISDGILTWVAKDSSKPGRPQKFETWVAHFSPVWTANHLDASDDFLHQQVLHFLSRLTDKPLPDIHQVYKHRWLYARSAATQQDIQCWDSDQKLGLAGDWTLGNRLEDAWTSANLLSDQLLAEFDA